MNYSEKVQIQMNRVVEAFQTDTIPPPLANAYLVRHRPIPMSQWSWRNVINCLIANYTDARGFKQWKEVDRFVIKGQVSHATILHPRLKRDPDDPDKQILYGFGTTPVFDITQTQGADLPDEPDFHNALSSLPLLEVAQEWKVNVVPYEGSKHLPAGQTLLDKANPEFVAIALGVSNPSTWAHEMIHVSERRLGSLTATNGQEWRNEVVAEFGGAVLLETLGLTQEADRGGCWYYISEYSAKADVTPYEAIGILTHRILNAVTNILDTAAKIKKAAAFA